MRLRLPVIKKRPEGFLVYAGSKLWTEQCVTREEATRIFDMIQALNPSVRVQIVGVHTLDYKLQKELSR